MDGAAAPCFADLVTPSPQLRLPVGLPGGSGTAFVGRHQNLEELERVWAAVEGGRRQVVFIGGEPGVGKTRLAAEAAAALHRHGATVLWGASYPDYDVPYHPVVTALEHLLDDAAPGQLGDVLGDSAQQLLRLTPKIRRHRPDLLPPEPAERESRLPLFDAVLDLLLALTVREPIVLVLEDLHWTTVPTLQLLAHLVQSSARARLLILVTHRTTAPDRHDDLTFAIADLYRHDGVSRMDLGGLATEEVADYLVRHARMPRAEALRSAAVLRDQTGGNPFFLHELWQDIAGRGGIEALRSARFQAPRSVRGTIDRRLAGLEPDHAEVLELCAVAGDVVELAMLVQASEHDAEVTLAAVDRGVEFGVLSSDPSTGRCRFAHALARQAVLDRLPPSRRVRLHAAIALALERRPGRDPSLVAQLAHHFSRAHALGYAEQAAGYLVQAGQHATRSLAHEEAAALYERAAALPAAGEHTREDLLFSAAHSHLLAGDFGDARTGYEELARSPDPDVLLRAAIGYEDTCWRPGVHGERSLELLDAGLRGRADDPTDRVYIRALASMGRAASFVGDHGRAEALGERALALARDLGDVDLLAHALCTTLWRGMTPSLAPQLLDRSVELSAVATGIGHDDALGAAAFYRAVFGYMLGRPEEWDLAREDLARTIRAGGQPFYRYVAGCTEYARAFACGAFDDASRIVATLEDLGAGFGPDTAEGSTGIQIFMLRRETDGLDAVRPLITGEEDVESHWAPGLLALYCGLGMWDAAARVLAHLLEQVPLLHGVSSQWAGVLAFMADAAVTLEDEEAAQVLHPLALEYAGLNLIAGQFVAIFGSADRCIARLESLLGIGDADAHFEAALAMDRHMGAVLHQVETLVAWAEHSDRTGGAAGRHRGRWLRDEAVAIGRRLALKRALRGGARPSADHQPSEATGPDGLTPREIDVLRVVAEGLSNREIGERLFISQNTAANHVRSILMKTGAPNRTSAAIYAADHDLLATER
jgi:DNA-binding CsgD family transcriptional regulator/tetratricopeptide (TPR) repeat protein